MGIGCTACTVYRLGAGKSSLIAAPYLDIKIYWIHVDCLAIGLHNQSSSNISVIPQSPILDTGTIKYNLDKIIA